MKIDLELHNIILFVGPSESGKTTFAKNILLPGLEYEDSSRGFKTNVKYLSTDDIRRDLLGENLHKYDQRMMNVSKLAFKELLSKVDIYSSYPLNAEFIVIDSTSLDEEFRKNVRDIARKNNYKVTVISFDFTKQEDYFDTDLTKKVVGRQLTKYKKEVIKRLSGEWYYDIFKIRRKDFIENKEKYVIEVNNIDKYIRNHLEIGYTYDIVGDIHEDIKALKNILIKMGYEIEDNKIIGNKHADKRKIISVGDWIDKGGNTREIVEFLYNNREWFLFVRGNHENFVFKHLEGIVDAPTEVKEQFFTSIKEFKKDEELYKKAKEMYETSVEFYKYSGGDNLPFIVTHAPCKEVYLGRMDDKSIKNQRNFRLDRENKAEDQLMFLKEESEWSYPYHIFGHVSSKDIIKTYNKLGIDTGSVNGNKLTAVSMNNNNRYLYSVKGSKLSKGELEEIFKVSKKRVDNISFESLENEDKKEVLIKAKNKINFISGTMSPADKDLENNELESLSKGLEYYKKKGVDKVILQPKYMGSRCNIYLNIDVKKSYAVSRNGYVIKKLDLTGVYNTLIEKHGKYMKDNNLEWLLLDGELLPWSALGKGLIDNTYRELVYALEGENESLKELGFYDQLDNLLNNDEKKSFDKDKNEMSKKELIEKYGNSNYQIFKNIYGVVPFSYEEEKESLEILKDQVELFGTEEVDLEFKAFSVLKMIDKEGNEFDYVNISNDGKYNNYVKYRFVSDDSFICVDLNEEGSLIKAKEFYDELVNDRRMEGVVIKPYIDVEGVAPYLKVRNENYLHIVYGYDYKKDSKYSKLIRNKRINKKLSTSIEEYEIGKELLKIPLKDIKINNKEYLDLMAAMLNTVKKEESIDPRL